MNPDEAIKVEGAVGNETETRTAHTRREQRASRSMSLDRFMSFAGCSGCDSSMVIGDWFCRMDRNRFAEQHVGDSRNGVGSLGSVSCKNGGL